MSSPYRLAKQAEDVQLAIIEQSAECVNAINQAPEYSKLRLSYGFVWQG